MLGILLPALVLATFFTVFLFADEHWFWPINWLARARYVVFGCLGSCCSKIVPEIVITKFRSIRYWILYQRNPLLQILYLCLILGAYFTYLFKVLPSVSNERNILLPYHTWNFTIFVFVALASWAVCVMSDPGTIRKHTLKEHTDLFPNDEILYIGKNCSVCHFTRPARAKHCYLCGCCVAKFDHHCAWVNNCIGLHNYRLFLFFLFLHVVACFYGAYLCGLSIYTIIERKQLFYATFRDSMGRTVPSNYFIVFQFMSYYYGTTIGLMLFTAVVGFTLLCFLGYHITLLLRNLTTNESIKRSDMKQELKELPPPPAVPVPLETKHEEQEVKTEVVDKKNKLNRRKVADSAAAPAKPAHPDMREFMTKLEQWDGRAPMPAIPGDSIESRKLMAQAIEDNIYNRGLRANIAEVLFPPLL